MKKFRYSIKIPASCTELFLPISQQDGSLFRRFGITMGGMSHLVGGYSITRVNPQHFVCIYVVHGNMGLKIEDSQREIGQGSFFILPPSMAYCYFVLATPCTIVWFHYDAVMHSKSLLEHNVVVKKSDYCQDLYNLISLYFKIVNTSIEDKGEVLKALSTSVLHLFKKDLPLLNFDNDYYSPLQKRIIQTWNAISNSLERQWKTAVMAQEACVSEPYFYILTKKYYQTTPQKKLTHLRLNRAAELLHHSFYPVKSIARKCGFQSSASFITAFKRQFGQTPKNFSKNFGGK